MDAGGIDVEVIDRGTSEDGQVLWVLVDSWDRSTAREVAKQYGRITESDVAEDGRWSFAVVASS